MAKKEMDDDEISSGNGEDSPLGKAAFQPDDKAYASNDRSRQNPWNKDLNPERTIGSTKRNPTDIGSKTKIDSNNYRVTTRSIEPDRDAYTSQL